MKSHKSIHRRTKKNSLARTRKTKHSNAKRISKKTHRGGAGQNPVKHGTKVTFSGNTKAHNGRFPDIIIKNEILPIPKTPTPPDFNPVNSQSSIKLSIKPLITNIKKKNP